MRADAQADDAQGDAHGGPVECERCDPPQVTTANLPPLPERSEPERSQQSWAGCGVVVGIIVFLVTVMHAIALGPLGDLPEGAWWSGLVLIDLEAAVALLHRDDEFRSAEAQRHEERPKGRCTSASGCSATHTRAARYPLTASPF